ncbi:NADPH-dependent 1-acyldihydroxyacetone phosphate reductase [Talaromyces pinophilus]|nr:NADPH-dependent 1-acyldihydroxyacetone phosphate reductase [Talaromyces pinophilus]
MPQQKTVLITGCSDGGIGSALAKAFQSKGVHVFATARTVSKMTSLEQLPSVKLLSLDVTSSSSIDAAVDAVRKETNGTLDYLINNAAINQYYPALDLDIAEAKRMFDTNYWGALEVTQKFAPLLIPKKGTVISVSSISAHANIPYCSALAASKRSLEILMDTMRVELKPFGVSTLSVVNGVVRSNAQNWKHFEDWKLPDNSLYKSLEQHIHDRISEKDGVYNDGIVRVDTAQHAQKLVDEILAGTTGTLWIGGQAGGVKFATKYMPQFILDKLFSDVIIFDGES